MPMINEKLKPLLELQEIDKRISATESRLERIPLEIAKKNAEIAAAQAAFEQEKTRLTAIQVERKQRELDLATQEEKIRKHELELNQVKSNDAYRALQNEINGAKQQKSETEDQILILMEEYDKTLLDLKSAEARAKSVQEDLQAQVRELQNEILKEKAAIEAETRNRETFIPRVAPDVLSRYDFIRKKKKSQAIVAISGESCAGCHTILTQSTLNEVKKGRELILCDSCSRILYFADAQPVA